MTVGRHIPTPNPDPESAPFWDAAREGRFLLRKCPACQKVHWYPRSVCPHCLSSNTDWVQGSGRGRIYSSTVFRQGAEPYAIAYVELDEGPRVLTNILADDLDSIAIGQRVEVVFVPSSDPPVQHVPFFRRIDEG
jgi:uncharacterized OB-fold protein